MKKVKKVNTEPILEEYTKRNNIEYDFFLTAEYIDFMFNFDVKVERIFISMVDSNNNTLQFEEIDNDTYEKDVIPIAKRLIRQQKLKELGI